MQNILKNSGLVLLKSPNYNTWQYAQFQKYIGNVVLEIGCGVGNLTQHILKDAQFVFSVDTKQEAIDFSQQRFCNEKNIHIKHVDIFKESLRVYTDAEFDTLIFSNVLEHIKDDAIAMHTCYTLLQKKGGILVLIVPAHHFLFGTLDTESGHHRRYTKKEIMHLALENNFIVKDIYAFNLIGALGWYINYCLFKRKNTNNTSTTNQMTFFDEYLVPLSKFVEGLVRPPIGLSYIAILEAKK